MPYIKPEDRKELQEAFCDANNIKELGGFCDNAGELNYVITNIIHGYHKAKGGKYQHANDILGALEGAKLEFYRRIVAPYEDIKIVENGDV